MPGPTSTPWQRCSTRCCRASRRSPARPRRRSRRNGWPARRRACASRARRSLSFWTRRSARGWRSSRPTASAPRPISPGQWYSAPRPSRHRQAALRELPAGFPGRPWPSPLGFLLGLGVLFAWRLHRTPAGQRPPDQARRLAVLPFESAGDTGDRAFADGMSEEIATRLARVPGLSLVARSSALQYRGVRPAGARVRPVTGGGLRARRHGADRRRSVGTEAGADHAGAHQGGRRHARLGGALRGRDDRRLPIAGGRGRAGGGGATRLAGEHGARGGAAPADRGPRSLPALRAGPRRMEPAHGCRAAAVRRSLPRGAGPGLDVRPGLGRPGRRVRTVPGLRHPDAARATRFSPGRRRPPAAPSRSIPRWPSPTPRSTRSCATAPGTGPARSARSVGPSLSIPTTRRRTSGWRST